MESKFTDYLNTFEIGEPLLNQISEIMNVFESVSGKVIEDIFLSEYKAKTGELNIENLWIFSENIVSESMNIRKQKDLDFLEVQKMTFHRFSWSEFDFITATQTSRLSIHMHINEKDTVDLRASSLNCGKLLELYEKYFKPKSAIKS